MSLAPSSSKGEAWKELPLQGVARREDTHMHRLPAGRNWRSHKAGRVGWRGALHQGRPWVLPRGSLKNKTTSSPGLIV